MFVAIIFILIIIASVWFHIWSPWWWTPVASNWGNIDTTIELTFWITGTVFVAVCSFMAYCVWRYRYRPDRKAEYKPEDKKLEIRLTALTALGVIALLAPGLVVWNKYVTVPENALKIAFAIKRGILAAADIAREHGMERAFAIAPTASCSYRSQDLDGYTCTPEIAPPISRTVDRDSGTFGVQTYDYGDVEIASEVGWDAYKQVADGMMTLLDRTGLLHGYSFNSWSDIVTYDNAFVEEWLRSPQTSLYYSLQVMGDTQDKSSAYAALDEQDVESYLEDILNEEITCDCQE